MLIKVHDHWGGYKPISITGSVNPSADMTADSFWFFIQIHPAFIFIDFIENTVEKKQLSASSQPYPINVSSGSQTILQEVCSDINCE